MDRRSFLGIAAASALPAWGAAPPIPIVDTHVHLFDPTRPQGIPWPTKDNALIYKPALPAQIRQVSRGLGVVGAIEVECSPWFDDNQWVLDVIKKDTLMLGTVGNLEPDKPEFRAQLERFHRDPLYLGIRYGNLWGRDLRAALGKPEFIGGLKNLATAGLVLDTANPTVELLEDVVRLTDRVPDLRIVLDHLPNLPVPQSDPARAAYHTAMNQLAARPQVFVKVSAVLQRRDGKVSYELSSYRPKLDEMWETFGEDRLLFGSDWPNSAPLGSYAQVLQVVREYFEAKGRAAAEKYFWRNSVKAYRWRKRAANQPNGVKS